MFVLKLIPSPQLVCGLGIYVLDPLVGSYRIPHVFLGFFAAYYSMSAEIHITHRVVPAIGIQVQSVSPVGVLLGESADNRVIVPCP